MTIHIEHPETEFSKCETFEDFDEFEDTVGDGPKADCIECIHFDEVQEEWEKYVSQPVNFGTKPDPIAEHDAFFAAAYTFIKKNYPF